MKQTEMILQYLREGHTITALEALNEFGCFRLASRINDLKNEGHNIESKMVTINTRRAGKTQIARYRLVA